LCSFLEEQTTRVESNKTVLLAKGT